MNSKSKIHLEKTVITELVKLYLGKECIDSVEITNGWFNTIFLIHLEDDSHCILKISPPSEFTVMRYEKDILYTEKSMLDLLYSAGIPVPRVLSYIETNPYFDHPCFFMEYVKGQTVHSFKEEQKSSDKTDFSKLNFNLGSLQAKINNLGSGITRWGLPASDMSYSSWKEALCTLVNGLLLDAADKEIKLPRSPGHIFSGFTDAGECLDEVKNPALIHWDLHDGNILISDTKITGVIDCDRAMYADPLMEYWFRTIACSDENFYKGYKSTIDRDIIDFDSIPVEHIDKRIRLYDLYLAMVIRIECAYRDYGREHTQWTEGLLEDYIKKIAG